MPRGSAATALSSVSPAVSSGASNPPESASESPAKSSAASTPSAADEAAALLAAVQIPPGAQEVTAAPAEPSVPWLVERTQSWQVPLGFDMALAWEKSHAPTGTESTGGGTGSGPGPSDHSVDLFYVPITSSPAWSDARLSIEVASGTPTISYLHVYAAAGAIDPTPYPDNVTDPRVRVTVAGGCPQSNGKGDGEVNHGADLATMMVPVAPPAAGLLCEYSGGISPTEPVPYRLIKSIPLDAILAAQIAAEIAQVPLAHVDGEMTSCPAALGAKAVIALSYAGRPDVDVWGTSDGCAWIANGRIATSGLYLANGVEDLVSPSTTVAQ